MDNKKRALILIILIIVVTSLVIVTQLLSQTKIDNSTLKTEIESLSSLTKESDLIIEQYNQDKLTFVYTKSQTEHINKVVNNFYSQIQSAQIEDSYLEKVNSLEKLTFRLSMDLKQIESSGGNKSKLKIIQNDLKDLTNKLDQEEKLYE